MAALAYGDWLARGRAHQSEGHPVDAMLCFRQAARMEPGATDPRFLLGEVLWQLGLFAEAIAAWRDARAVGPNHPPAHYALAEALLVTGDSSAARDVAAGLLPIAPDSPRRRAIEATARLFLAEGTSPGAAAERAEAVDAAVEALRREPALLSVLSVAGSLAQALDRLPAGAERDALVDKVVLIANACGDAATMPALMLTLMCEGLKGAAERDALFTRALGRSYMATEHDALRRIARAGASLPAVASPLAACYASLCLWAFGSPVPLAWPRRTAGIRSRVVLLVDGDDDAAAAVAAQIVDATSNGLFDVTVATQGAPVGLPEVAGTAESRIVMLEVPAFPDAAVGKRIWRLRSRCCSITDLGGWPFRRDGAAALRSDRREPLWTIGSLRAPNAVPLIDRVLDDKAALEQALRELHEARDPAADSALDPVATAALWIDAVRRHQQGDRQTAIASYADVLAEQPGFAMAHFLRGVAYREVEDRDAARAALLRAVEAAPGYAEARAAAAKSAIDTHEPRLAVTLCEAGLALAPSDVGLWRTLGLAQLALRDGVAATGAFQNALALAPTDAETHYNHGVALQMQGDIAEAARAYQRALVFQPDFVAADYNLGVLFQEQRANDAAITAYGNVLRADPRHVAAYKNLGEVLFAAGRIDAWLLNFARFEANCPTALPLAVQALEACQYLPDFTKLERYLDGLRQERFRAGDELELADALEQLLYLLLYFDVEPEMIFKFAQTYDTTARRVYGEPLPRPPSRRPGRVRVGYVSGDLRNHVQGKMMWQAIQHHDKGRFELFFYSLSREEDDWTARFRGIADRYESIASLTERAAAERIAVDDLDLLVDLATHTRGAKPGIMVLKPARVQITHVASAGALGLSTVDFKLTDRYADLPENQAYQLETLLPMDGCVYPYRHIVPATEHPFHRARLGIAPDTVVIGAFVSGLKLSRRCLALWGDVLNRVPKAKLAFSPVSPAIRVLYTRLAAAGGIAPERLIFLPQGRDDAENQARYELVDFVLDPTPYGGVNGTLEALDMGVPVVTLVGKRHAERTPYSILTNLGVSATIAHGGREYVDIAVRLGQDAAFMREVRAAIQAGLADSPLTDMPAHTRNLERAYLMALAERCPDVLDALPVG